MKRLLVATRSADKLREIRGILRDVPDLEVIDLQEAEILEDSREDEIEAYETFHENALAKARYFHERSGSWTVADDSGLVVDALEGRPGVHSKRFAPGGEDLPGEERDVANNQHLLSLLGDLELARRTARYVCVAALVRRGREPLFFEGEVEGLILGRPRGWSGFGYDPLFFHSALGRTFAEIDRARKSALSHRGAAFRELSRHLSAERGEGA